MKAWHKWLADSFPTIRANTHGKISDAFRLMLREQSRDEAGRPPVPDYPEIKVPPAVRSTMDLGDRAKAIAAIPHKEKRPLDHYTTATPDRHPPVIAMNPKGESES